MLENLSAITKLIRLNAPIGYFLVFFPSAFGLFLGYEKSSDLYYLVIFAVGSVLTRGAGCIINDFFDKDFDKKVERTKNRPLANNTISHKLAFVILLLMLSLALALLLFLSFMAIILGFMAFCMILTYPLMKRFTYFPQIFLAITFNFGCLIAYASVRDNVSLVALLMYFACGCWICVYDTIYAFMDIKDDKLVGIKSIAIFLENKPYKLIMGIGYSLFVVFYAAANLLSNNFIGFVGSFVAAPLLMWQVKTLNIFDARNCLIRFKSNKYVGMILFTTMFFGVLL